MKKVFSVLTATALCALLLTGCGNKSTSSQPANNNASSASKADSSTAQNTGAASGPITVISREDGSGTRGAFIEIFKVEEKDADGKKVDMTTEEAEISNSTEVMIQSVAGNPSAIGYISLGSLDDTVKALEIDGAAPSVEAIKSGSYKVSRPFNIATKSDLSNEVAKDFISYIMSKEGQAVVTESGYIGDDAAAPYAGSKPSGKVTVAGSSSVAPMMEKLAEAYKIVNPSADVELQTSDSTTGMSNTIDGVCDIGMASRELKDEEISAGLSYQVIATDGIAVIVNKESACKGLTSDQVKAIYKGETTDWAKLS